MTSDAWRWIGAHWFILQTFGSPVPSAATHARVGGTVCFGSRDVSFFPTVCFISPLDFVRERHTAFANCKLDLSVCLRFNRGLHPQENSCLFLGFSQPYKGFSTRLQRLVLLCQIVSHFFLFSCSVCIFFLFFKGTQCDWFKPFLPLIAFCLHLPAPHIDRQLQFDLNSRPMNVRAHLCLDFSCPCNLGTTWLKMSKCIRVLTGVSLLQSLHDGDHNNNSTWNRLGATKWWF